MSFHKNRKAFIKISNPLCPNEKTTDRQNPSIFLLSPTFRQYSQRIVYHLAAQVHFRKKQPASAWLKTTLSSNFPIWTWKSNPIPANREFLSQRMLHKNYAATQQSLSDPLFTAERCRAIKACTPDDYITLPGIYFPCQCPFIRRREKTGSIPFWSQPGMRQPMFI